MLVNVLGFWEPLRQLVKSSIQHGFIKPVSENIIIFVDGPADQSLHETFDWGKATLQALDTWDIEHQALPFDWTKRIDGTKEDSLAST